MIHAKILTVDPKTVEMGIVPSEGNLECLVKIGDRLVRADQKPTPDHRTDTAQPSLELIDFVNSHHAVTLSKFRVRFSPWFAPVSRSDWAETTLCDTPSRSVTIRRESLP